MPTPRDTTYSIFKALAILLVVLAHASAPTYVARMAYMVGVPAFFVLAGYFFKTDYLEEKGHFIIKRIKRLYFPFVKWSLLFLLIHNLLFPLGLLSERYGNAAGGVLHPYDAHGFMQNLWSIVFNMSGYDAFLTGAYWFFRALLISEIAFLFLFKGASLIKWLRWPAVQVAVVGIMALAMALWQTAASLVVPGIAQGGYREFMGICFLSIGFLIRQSHDFPAATVWRNPLVAIVLGSVVLGVLVIWAPQSMTARPGAMPNVPLLALAGTAAFVWLRAIAVWLNRTPPRLKETLIYIGDNSIYVFGFHLAAFKLVSALKVAVYGMPWEMVGGHPVVVESRDYGFWIRYAIVGTAVPLLTIKGWEKFCERYHFDWANPRDWLRMIVKLGYVTAMGLMWLCVAIGRGIIRFYRNLTRIIKEIMDASNPREDE